MNDQQAKAVLAKIMQAIVETVNEAPNGAPCGPLYTALMHVWPTLSSMQFNLMIASLEATGKVRRVGHLLYAVKAYESPIGPMQPGYLAGSFDRD